MTEALVILGVMLLWICFVFVGVELLLSWIERWIERKQERIVELVVKGLAWLNAQFFMLNPRDWRDK